MSTPIGNNFNVSQVSRVQQSSTTEKTSSTSTADKLQDRGTVAEQLKTKLESFKSGASNLLERSKGNLAIGSGASLIGLGVVGAVILAPITIPGALLGALMGSALSKSQTAKEAFGSKGDLVNAGLTIGSCLTYGLGLLGAKLIEYGVNKNRVDKDVKPAQTEVKQKAEEKVDSSEISNESNVDTESMIATTKPLEKPTLEQLENELMELNNNYSEASSSTYKDSIGDKLRVATKQIENCDKQIDTERESMAYCNEIMSGIEKKYEGPDKGKFNKMFGDFIMTPKNKQEAFLNNLNNADVMQSLRGHITMDHIKSDLKSLRQNVTDVASSKVRISEFTKQRDDLKVEINGLLTDSRDLKSEYDKKSASLEKQINILKKEGKGEAPKPLTDEELVNRGRVANISNHNYIFGENK